MERVNIGEFRQRMLFWLNNLPIELARDGKTVAIIQPAGSLYKEIVQDVQVEPVQAANSFSTKILTEDEPEPVQTPQQETIAALRALIAPLEGKVDTSTGEIQPPEIHKERRRYTEYDDQRGEDILIEGTFDDFRVKCGSKGKAAQTWRMAKPVK